MAGKIATRNAYGEALAELAEKYPERFLDCGIAECNRTGIAAGMATAGLKPFTNTFAMFAAGRAYEQVRNSVAYPHLKMSPNGPARKECGILRFYRPDDMLLPIANSEMMRYNDVSDS